jgi:hypothetical protein
MEKRDISEIAYKLLLHASAMQMIDDSTNPNLNPL